MFPNVPQRLKKLVIHSGLTRRIKAKRWLIRSLGLIDLAKGRHNDRKKHNIEQYKEFKKCLKSPLWTMTGIS